MVLATLPRTNIAPEKKGGLVDTPFVFGIQFVSIQGPTAEAK